MIRHTAKALLVTLAGVMLLGSGSAVWGQRQESPEAMHQRASAMADANREEARKLWDAACAKDHVPACMALGESHSPYFGSAERALGAKAAFSRACDLGHGEGCLRLGDAQSPISMVDGSTGAPDWPGAEAAYRKACDKFGIAKACYNAAEVMSSSRNPQANTPASGDYYIRACDLKASEGCSKAAIVKHTRKYQIDGRAAAEPGLFQFLRGNRTQSNFISLNEDTTRALHQYLLADDVIDEIERDLVAELTNPEVVAVKIYPTGTLDPQQAEALTISSLRSLASRNILLPLLDAPTLMWDESDRKATLMRLARASRTSGMEGPVKALIAGKVAALAPSSSKETRYQPVAGMIIDLASAAKALEAECKLPRLETDAIRQMFFEAMESGVVQSGASLPLLYGFLKPTAAVRPLAATDLPKDCGEEPHPAGS